MNDFDLKDFHQAARSDKITAVNRLGADAAVAILEMGRRMDLRPDELAWAMLATVGIVIRNRGGVKLTPKNLRTFAGKLHDYANMLDLKHAQPTDDILPS